MIPLRRRSVFVAILISYFCILIVPTVAGGVGYQVLENTLVRNVNKSNFAMLEHAQQLVDSRMKEVDRLSLQFAMNANVQWLLNNPDSEHGDVQLRLLALMKEMQSFRVVNDFLESIFIYFSERGMVVTPTMQTGQELYFRRIQHFENQADMAKLLSSYHNQKFLPMNITESGSTQKMLTFIQSLPIEENKDMKGSLVILINEQKIVNLLQRMDWDGNSSTFILDKDGNRLVTSMNEQFVSDDLASKLNGNAASFEMEKDGRSLLVSYTTGYNGWKYVTVVPDEIVMKPINRVKQAFIILLAVGIIAGVVISFYMAYRNYRPINELLRVIKKRSIVSGIAKMNEFEIINSTLMNSFEEEQSLKKTLAKQAPLIQSNFISRLIKGNVDIASLDQASLEFMEVSLENRSYRVLLLDIEGGKKFMKSETEQELALVRFTLTNISLDLLQGKGFVVELERNRLAILELVEGEHHPGQDEWIYAFKQICETRFQFNLTIAVSQQQIRPEHIWKCYLDALLALERRVVMGSNTIIFHEPIGSKGTMYHYPIEFEVLLINYAKTGDYMNAVKILTQIYEENFMNSKVSPEMGRFLFMEILASLLKVIHASAAEEAFPSELEDPATYFAACHSASEMLEQVKRLLHDICSTAKEVRTDQGERLYNGILKFVKDHYHDGNLSLTMIADEQRITPQYLSAFFKKYTGKNISDLIAEYRVEQAKIMLGDRTLTVGEISRRVGYSNHIGFGRVFKKIEGITPGQYRELRD